ncbi:MAG TPA: TauD/TfdA family dioxygenase [Burkholderiales bacterium]|jgi:alpha-ketoglutarate-dependent taurine dioxygenase|nr:TauD/TfdA family dioxygenase [Burkholderiales bacterium]
MALNQISGPQTWKRDGITPKDWLMPLPGAAVAELDAVVERLRRNPRPAESLAPGDFELATCADLMTAARHKLNEIGLAVVDRVPVERYSVSENQAVGWLLAGMLGPVVAQSWTGTRLYDVKDTGQKLGYGVRRSVTDLGQPFHTDAGWLWLPPAYVGLFCIEAAPEGGLSRCVSLVTAHNDLARRAPELLARLYRPFAWDRQAEHAPDAPRFSRHPVFEHDGHGTLMARWYEDYIHNGHKLAHEPLDDLGREALGALTGIVDDPGNWVEFRIERGQLQYINNRQFAHSRTAFKDAPDGSQRRHLIRLWNRSEGTTDLEGGA